MHKVQSENLKGIRIEALPQTLLNMHNHDSSLQSAEDLNAGSSQDFQATEEAGTDKNATREQDVQSSAREQWKEMSEERLKNNIDPSLESPQDSNTGKHINFLENEETKTGDHTTLDEESPTR